MKPNCRLITVSVLAAVLLVVGSSPAQNANTGAVVGVVSDPSGAVIANAAIELRDLATNTVRTTATNANGRYNFASVLPGKYSITAAAQGFQKSSTVITVEVSKSYTVNLAMKVGQAEQVVEVVSNVATAELQTMDSTVGSALGGDTLMNLPSQSRNVSSLLLLQPASMPQQGPGQGSRFGGQVAGAQSDQNTITLDGGNVTNGVSGNSDYYTNFRGGPEAPIPTPVESIQEFRVATNNPNASFSGAAGSQVMLVTKRGTNAWHGSAYWYLQNDNLNANSWDRNRLHQPRPESKDNRYGASLGGYIPRLPEEMKTYFYMNWEGRRRSQITQIQKLVPSNTLRQGILRFRDASGNIISYNLATATTCGTTGTSPCDPLALGLDPLVAQVWSKLPAGNDPSNPSADGLNTIGFSGPLNLPIRDDFAVVRLDHSLGKNWQVMGSYRIFTQDAAVDKQVDIGGQLAGHTSGQPVSAAAIPRQPRYVVLGLTGQITPAMTNQFNFSFMRDWWKWITAGASPQVPGTAGALQIGGEAQNTALVPMNIDTNSVRQRTWNSHNLFFRDDLTWLRGNHLLQFGGSLSRNAVAFDRNDGQSNALNQFVYQLTTTSGVNISSAFRPRQCSASVITNCLPQNQTSQWNNLYASALGLVDTATILGTRNAALQPNPLGTPATNDVRYNDYSLYVNDAWHVVPSLTLNFGLNWSTALPPTEITGKQAVMVDLNNAVVNPWDYLQQRKQATLNGQVFNPVVGFSPIKRANRNYPWNPDWTDFAPRIAAAWSPHLREGILGKLFGENKTVIRGGYGILYDRLNGVQKVINALQGFGFQQTLICLAPSTTGQCRGAGGTDPSTAFRIGVNGSTVPIPSIAALTTTPLVPGTTAIAAANQPFAPTTFQMDPQYKPGRNYEFDLTIQRELTRTTILELGYIKHTADGIYSPLQLNQVPFFMKSGGQTFAQAYDAVSTALRAGGASNVTAQPFFESALAGSSFCAAPNTSCTAGVVSRFSGNFLNQQVFNLWNSIQPSFVFGPATASSNQVQNMFFWSGRGHSNYNAGFIALHERNWKGLTLDANLTYAHSLDDAGVIQDVDSAVPNAFDLHYGYGTSAFDRKFVLNLLGNWQLPFGKGQGFADHFTRGWSLSPIFTWYSGLPLKVLVGSSQEFGQTFALGAGAVRTNSNSFGNSVHSGISGDPTTQIATAGDPTKGGTGLNLFADPVAAFNSFRPILLASDTSSGGGGQLRGQARWNIDLTLARKLQVTERFTTTISAQFFNLFNHVQFDDPAVSLQRPQTFGVISTQMNSPRAIELGLHFDF